MALWRHLNPEVAPVRSLRQQLHGGHKQARRIQMSGSEITSESTQIANGLGIRLAEERSIRKRDPHKQAESADISTTAKSKTLGLSKALTGDFHAKLLKFTEEELEREARLDDKGFYKVHARVVELLGSNRKQGLQTKLEFGALIDVLHVINAGRGRDGKFEPTLKELCIPVRRGREWMDIFRMVRQFAPDINITPNFCTESLLQLSRKSTPREVKQSIFDQIRKDPTTYVTIDDAKAAIEEAKQQDAPAEGLTAQTLPVQPRPINSGSTQPVTFDAVEHEDQPLFAGSYGYAEDGMAIRVEVDKDVIRTAPVLRNLLERAYQEISREISSREIEDGQRLAIEMAASTLDAEQSSQ